MLIKRNQYLEHIRRFYESNLIKVLTGVRRCGKSVGSVKNSCESKF